MKPKLALIRSVNDCEQPSFGEVQNIYVRSGSAIVWLDLGELETITFDSHLHSWTVRRTDNSLLVKFSDLACTQILPIRPVRHTNDLLLHVTLKFAP